MLEFYVKYHNGESIHLWDKIAYENLPKERIRSVLVTLQDKHFYEIHFDEGKKLICRRRAKVDQSPNPAEPMIWFVGWQEKVNGRNIQSLTWFLLFDNGEIQIHQTGRFDDKHPWFYPPNFREFEK